ncbi:MAG TPA: SDR family NAD(P)-dependent oxidoreductase [Myxococcaceae bacterium]|nr:SDR family NAD(P)-dependent oxidoreductase [Myxococcaceae bacterium]
MSHAVVTGGASGLGRALATRLHDEGWSVDLWDRDAAALESALYGRERVGRRLVDVRSAEEVRRGFEELRAEPQLVFHAAGVCHVGDLESLRLDECRLDMEVNYLGTLHVLHAAAARLQPGSQVICVASVAGLKGLPEFAGYGATKFAVLGFCEAVEGELRRRGIALSVLCPPAVATPMVRNLSYHPALYSLFPFSDERAVVETVLRGMRSRRFLLTVDRGTRALRLVDRLAPRLLARYLDWRVQRYRRAHPEWRTERPPPLR